MEPTEKKPKRKLRQPQQPSVRKHGVRLLSQKYSDDFILDLIEQSAEGVSIHQLCKSQGIKFGTIFHRINNTPHLFAADARARNSYAAAKVSEMEDIAKTEPDVARARLRCDNVKWEMARVCRRIYGDRDPEQDQAAAANINIFGFGDK